MKNEEVVKALINKNLKITTMESCTGGLLISSITDVEGASNITDGGFVAYSNKQKVAMGVPKETIETYGVYSKETALKMAEVCRNKMSSDIGVGITGTLSNVDVNNSDSKQGEVYFAIKYLDSEELVKKINVPITSRHKQKEFILENIFEELEIIIDKNYSKKI